MLFHPHCRRVSAFLAAIIPVIIAFLTITPAQSEPILTLKADSAYICNVEDSISIPIRLDATEDTIGSITIWIMLDRPDVFYFSGSTYDMVDTAGTLLSGWLLSVGSVGSGGFDIVVEAVPPSGVTGLFPPVTDAIPLLKLKAHAYSIPDTLSEPFARLLFNYRPMNYFEFHDPQGELIGTRWTTVIDTSYFRCDFWLIPPPNGICLNYSRVYWPPYDSTFIDTAYTIVIDTNLFEIIDGFAGIYDPGDANGDRKIDIRDITYLVIFLYQQGPSARPYGAGDANADGLVNLRDITFLIRHLYQSGPGPICR